MEAVSHFIQSAELLHHFLYRWVYNNGEPSLSVSNKTSQYIVPVTLKGQSLP